MKRPLSFTLSTLFALSILLLAACSSATGRGDWQSPAVVEVRGAESWQVIPALGGLVFGADEEEQPTHLLLRQGDLITAVIRDIRREKNRQGIPLNAPLKKIVIYAEFPEQVESLFLGNEDISATLKIDSLEIHEGEKGVRLVEGYPGVRYSILE